MFPVEQFDLFHVFRLKKVGIFFGQFAAKAADAAVQVPLHQRLKGGKVAPLDGVQQVAVVTFILCMAGLRIGKKFGTQLSGKANILGGVILIGIGLEIFITGVF